MDRMKLLPILAVLVAAAPASGQQARPVGERDPNVIDVAKTPVNDLNLAKEEIPELLIQAQNKPYDLEGLGRCSQLVAAVEEFDAVLGPDFDLPQDTRDQISSGRVGKAVVGSLIPFRGLIREVSGANKHQLMVRAAVQAGLARRGFLKGVGQSRGCNYPASPATRADVAAIMAQRQAAEENDKD